VAAAARRQEQGLDLSALLGLQQDIVRCPYALYDQPDRESGAGRIAFGIGSHACLAAPLARIEDRVAVEVFLDRVEASELADPEHVEYLPSYISHGPARLPLRVRAAAPRPAAAGAHPGAGDG
jgi:hypothetical protein